MARNPKFHTLLQRMAETHDRKNHDYASDTNPYSNFEEAAALVTGFTNPLDQVFAALIGVKIARLRQLTAGKSPNNESVQDTRQDLAVYTALWASYYEEAPQQQIRVIDSLPEWSYTPGFAPEFDPSI